MRIGVVTTSYPRFAGDPAGNFVGEHVAALRALGHDVDVIAAGDGPDRVASRLFYDGGAPDALERGGGLLDAASFTARLAFAVARRARHWDRAIAHWLVPSALAALPARVPLTAIAHGGDIHTLARMHLLRPALIALRHARLVFVSAELESIARRHGFAGESIVQSMGVDTARFAAIPRAPETPPIVLVIARLVPIKGVDVALAAMARLRVPARLIVAGDGPERRASSEFIGAVDTAQRDQLLGRASVVAIPSRVLANGRSEGTPLVALEALAAGVPVVASAVGGLADLPVTLVAPEDPDALARAIEKVLAAPPENLRASVAHLDWRAVAERLLV
jgi:glycosyltransferase involved in cell wall biosynthesis